MSSNALRWARLLPLIVAAAPLVAQGAIVGALGVSGGTVEEDIAVMNEAINKVMGVQK